jgi:ADP-ribose pyrophosphatase YjhB (NUDIX family)
MKEEVIWRGQKYLMEWLDETNFENLDDATHVCGFIFDENKNLCIVDTNKGYWGLPGGAVEEIDETFEVALMREAEEEADLEIKEIIRIGCFKVTPISENCERGVHHLLRFVARVNKIKDQTIDPAEGVISLRKFIDPSRFLEFVDWKDSGQFQLDKALAVLIN